MTTQDLAVHDTTSEPRAFRRPLTLPPIGAEFGFVACSSCLRVQRGATWIEPEEVIRELRSYELPDAPRIRPGLCDRCRAAIDAKRRATRHEAAA
jgi:hypothetical protein